VEAPPAPCLLIFVDTSVWIAALRNAEGLEARHLSTLIDKDDVALSAPVFLEILSGASRRTRPTLKTFLVPLPIYQPGSETWRTIEGWIETAGDSGDRFGIADLLIGAIAAENGGVLWSLDGDFARMARLKLLMLYAPSPDT
jgi:predicted nucleic acid-binding protein